MGLPSASSVPSARPREAELETRNQLGADGLFGRLDQEGIEGEGRRHRGLLELFLGEAEPRSSWGTRGQRRRRVGIAAPEVLHPTPPVGRWPGLPPDARALGLQHLHTCLIPPPASAAQPTGLSPGPPPWEALPGTPVPDPAAAPPSRDRHWTRVFVELVVTHLRSSCFSCFCSVFPMRARRPVFPAPRWVPSTLRHASC